jgi:hypothetical protein
MGTGRGEDFQEVCPRIILARHRAHDYYALVWGSQCDSLSPVCLW